MKRTWIAMAAGLIALPAFAGEEKQMKTEQKTGARPTEPFRKEHLGIQEHLAHVDAMIRTLPTAKPEAQQKAMAKIYEFYNGDIKPHAEWEEKVLYPAVDKRAAQGANVFTSTMRYEHRIVGRWIDELKQERDPAAFARKADQLLGLIRAHFEEEEEVLLPVLDKTMTPDEFHREIGATHAG